MKIKIKICKPHFTVCFLKNAYETQYDVEQMTTKVYRTCVKLLDLANF